MKTVQYNFDARKLWHDRRHLVVMHRSIWPCGCTVLQFIRPYLALVTFSVFILIILSVAPLFYRRVRPQSPKVQDYLRSPQPNRQLHIYSRLNTRTTCWLKNATKLNFLTKIFPILPSNPGFLEIDSRGKRNESNEAMSWSIGKVTR